MMQRVFVLGGKLMVGRVAFQLTRREDGSIEEFDFRGTGFLEGSSLNLLRHGDWGPVSEYVIADAPTAESVAFDAGYTHAEQQKIKRHPGPGRHESFYQGWRALWSERRPFKYPDEIRAERNERRRQQRKVDNG